jgi:hypothetical protein
VHPPKTSKGHFPGVKTLGIESNGAEAPESHCCCTSGGRLLQKERSLANRPLRLCTLPRSKQHRARIDKCQRCSGPFTIHQ